MAALLAVALFAGCSGETSGPESGNAAQANAAATAPHDTLYHQGWSEVWANPAQTQDYFNRIGYRFLEAYKPADGGIYRSVAVRTPLNSEQETKTPNVAFYSLEGTERQIDRVVYRLDIVSADAAPAARARLATFIKDTFWTLGLPGDKAVAEPLKEGQAASGSVNGAAWSVEPSALPGGKPGDRRITVTFSRPDASRAAPQQG